MTTLCSYDLNGKKLSFANWISNLSPQDTPFTSMTGKESINQTLFQWQTDALSKAADNAHVEGDVANEYSMKTTAIKSNITQILRKTVKVSDTANALANYGRGRELQYQMEKAGKEIKRDLEWTFLHNVGSKEEDLTTRTGRQTAGFRGLVAGFGAACPETKAIVHTETKELDAAATTTLTEKALFGMTYNLYLAGSRADIIMFHPAHASFFSSLQEKAGTGAPATRQRIFESTPKFSVHVSTVVDPLGQEYKLIPNRWMPKGTVYFFNSSDWTQMVLRAPQRTKLAKDGSYEKWMIELEVGLRHRHPFASGVLDISTTTATDNPHSTDNTTVLDGTTKAPVLKVDGWDFDASGKITGDASAQTSSISTSTDTVVAKEGSALKVGGIKSALGTAGQQPSRISVLKDGKEIFGKSAAAGTAVDLSADTIVVGKMTKADAGIYAVQASVYKDGKEHVYVSYGANVHVARDQNDTNIAAPILV